MSNQTKNIRCLSAFFLKSLLELAFSWEFSFEALFACSLPVKAEVSEYFGDTQASGHCNSRL